MNLLQNDFQDVVRTGYIAQTSELPQKMPVNLGIRAMFLHSVLDVSLESYVFSFIKDVYV